MPQVIKNTDLSSFAESHLTPTTDFPWDTPLVQASDPKMELPSLQLFKEIIAYVKPKMPKASAYTQNGKFDCDDYSFLFKGFVAQWYQKNRPNDLPMAIGIGWGLYSTFGNNEYHSLNWVFLDDSKLYWIEPQDVREKSFDAIIKEFDGDRDRVNLLMV